MTRDRGTPTRIARPASLVLFGVLLLVALLVDRAAAQDSPAPATRRAALEQAQADKSATLRPFEPGKAERALNWMEDVLVGSGAHVHPFFESAYSGGGFTLGAGYVRYLGAYSFLDLRGSLTLSGYKRIEAVFTAPRLLKRRATLSLTAGWREATEVGFYGVGHTNTSRDDRANYAFDQPYGRATLDVWPARKLLLLRGGFEWSQWNQRAGGGAAPSVDEVYTPDTLTGLGANPVYLHSEATIALDSRPFAGYARRGSFLGVTLHDFHDREGRHGFRRMDYELIQHVPILRETWVLSLHGRAQLASPADGQTIPFFMLPSLGGGSSLRGFPSWRFRDRHSLLWQAEWRVIANRFLDMALLYDAGRVAARSGDLTNGPLKSDYGVGFRLHGAATTPLRIEVVHGNEGFKLVFSGKAAF